MLATDSVLLSSLEEAELGCVFLLFFSLVCLFFSSTDNVSLSSPEEAELVCGCSKAASSVDWSSSGTYSTERLQFMMFKEK